MLIDRQTLLSDKQAVTATAFSSDCYDTGNVTPVRNLGRSDLRAVVVAGAATVRFELIEADDAAGTGANVLMASGDIPKAQLVAGAKPFDVPIPDHNKRFIMGRYTVGTGPLTQGQFSFGLLTGSDYQRAYPGGYPQAF
jgi:hypothetical protein